MTAQAEGEARKVARAPFDDVEADVVLRSSDNVDFRVYRAILSVASPFFKSMFTLKQPPVVDDEHTHGEKQPTEPITVSEDSVILDALLRFCYPVRDPAINDCRQLGLVLEAALKYDMDDAAYVAEQLLSLRVWKHNAESLDIYAIFYRLSLEDAARSAAQAYRIQLGLTFWPNTQLPSDEWRATTFEGTVPGRIKSLALTTLSAGAYFRLLQFLRTGSVATFCDPPANVVHSTKRKFPDFSDTGANIDLRSSDGRHFLCHKLVLTLASARRLIPDGPGCDGNKGDDVPLYDVDIDGDTLNDLLIACYPPQDTSVDSEIGDDTAIGPPLHVLPAARRYEISPLLSLAKSRWQHYVAKDSLAAYCVAIYLGWEKQAQQAARGTLGAGADLDIIHRYTAEMEQTPAQAYQKLLKYHYHCYQAAIPIISVSNVTGGGGISDGHNCADKNRADKEKLEQVWAEIKLEL